ATGEAVARGAGAGSLSRAGPGRRVYLGSIVALATAMQQGPTPWGAAQLVELRPTSTARDEFLSTPLRVLVGRGDVCRTSRRSPRKTRPKTNNIKTLRIIVDVLISFSRS